MTFRPTTLFGYCIGILLCPISMNTMKATTDTIRTIRRMMTKRLISPARTSCMVL